MSVNSVKGFRLTDGSTAKYDYAYLENIITDKELTEEDVAADGKAVGDAIDDVMAELSDLETDLTDVKSDLAQFESDIESDFENYVGKKDTIYPKNFLHGTFSIGVLNQSGEVDTASTTSTTDSYLEIYDAQKITVTRQSSATERTKMQIKAIAFYDSSYSLISASIGASGQQLAGTVFDVPERTKYVKFSLPSAYATTSSYYLMLEPTDSSGTIRDTYIDWETPIDTFLPSHLSDLIDKNICVFGDSLAASGNGGTDTWIQRVADYYGCANAYNRGIGSSCITSEDKNEVARVGYAYVDAEGDAYNRGMYTTQQTITGYTEISPWMNGTDRANTIPTDTDVVIVLAGANDVSTTNETMFKEAYTQMLQNIMERVPNAKIITCTLVYHHAYDSDSALKAVYDRYRGYIKEISADFGFPCIDLRSEMGCNNNNYTDYMNTDGVHFNTKAGRILTAECVAGNLHKYAKIYN